MKIPKKNRGGQEINISSSSDIAFLLIIFFLVTSSFMFKDGLRLALPADSSEPMVVTKDEVAILTLQSDGNLLLSDEAATEFEIEEELALLYAENPELIVLIQVENDVIYQRVIEIVDIMKVLDINKFSLKMI